MAQQQQKRGILRDALPIWWQVARPWFVGSERMQSLRYVGVCVTLAVIHTLVAVRVSYAQKHFSTALAEKNKAAWMSAVWEFVVIICLFAPIRSLESYAEKRMVAVWRTYLTQVFITAYTTNKAYFHMQLARGTEGTQAGPEDAAVAAAVGHAASTHLLQSSTPSAVAAAAAQQQAHLTDALARSSSISSSVLDPHSPSSKAHSPLPRLKTLRSSSDSGHGRSPARLLAAAAAAGKSRGGSFDARLPPSAQSESAPLLPGSAWGGGGSSKHQQPASKLGSGQALAAAGAVQQQGMDGGSSGGVVAGLSDASAQVDNPDQRITADVSNYVQTSVGLVLLLVRKTLNCAAFAGVLWSISPKLVVFLLSYALLGTFGTAAVFGAPLTRLKQKLLRLEADLRFGLVRLRENAEAIAFYGGDVREASDLHSRLVVVLDVLLRRIAWLGGYELWLVVYRYATILIPSLVLAPEYFAGIIEFGTMTQASFAFNVLEEALRLILEKMEDLSSLAAETGRLAGLLAALRAADVDAGGDGSVVGFGAPPPRNSHSSSSSSHQGQQQLQLTALRGTAADDDDDLELAAGSAAETTLLLHGIGSSSTGPDHSSSSGANGVAAGVSGSGRVSRVLRLLDGSVPGLSVEGLTACVPGRHHQPTVVCWDLGFCLQPGESLLVMGPSGCGKSSLLRIIAGLWTVGSGTLRGPAKPFFLPQKPFMPIGSLRQQLLFPTNCPKVWPAAAAAAGSSHHALSQPRQHLQHGADPSHHHHTQQQQEQASEASPLLGSSRGSGAAGHSGLGSSTAVKPSSVVQRGAGHARGASIGSSRHSFEPELPPSSASSASSAAAAAAAAAADYPGGTSSSSSSGPVVVDMQPGSSAASSAGGVDAAAIDQQLQALLGSVRLGHLLTRFPGGLDTELDFASVLSLGEQQRVALVRLLFHQPSLAFLDEATAALDPKSEALVYGLIAHACSCYVSVGHRLQLLEWHSHVLVATGAGHWAKYTAAEYRQRLADGLEG